MKIIEAVLTQGCFGFDDLLIRKIIDFVESQVVYDFLEYLTHQELCYNFSFLSGFTLYGDDLNEFLFNNAHIIEYLQINITNKLNDRIKNDHG
jgi:hypothetical protein